MGIGRVERRRALRARVAGGLLLAGLLAGCGRCGGGDPAPDAAEASPDVPEASPEVSDPVPEMRTAGAPPGHPQPPALPPGVEEIHAYPANLVEELFRAARAADVDGLELLCDPTGAHDDGAAAICASASANKLAFLQNFSTGRISSPVVLAPDGHTAEVQITFGVDRDRTATLRLSKHRTGWYLLGFAAE